MLVPVCVPIGGYKVRIEYVDSLKDEEGNEVAAEVVEYENKIRVNTHATNNSSAIRLFSTLFHECTHIGLELTGHKEWLGLKREESIVYALESMLAPLFDFRKMPGIKWKEVKFPWEKAA